MQLEERPVIDAALVRRLVAEQFPSWSGLPVEPVVPGGWDNRTFRLGRTMSVRLPSAARYAAQIEREHSWLPRLAPELPLPIPQPLALGRPAAGYPYRWSVNRWLVGETVAAGAVEDRTPIARDLAHFLSALHRIEASGAPVPGEDNFFRGGALGAYDGQVRSALDALGDRVDRGAAEEAWAAALATSWERPPVWVHGDIAPGNLLLDGGRLAAVIDWGQLCAGDPACDLAIAWTTFDRQSRAAFRAGLDLDEATWARARGWALWKALIVWAALPGVNPQDAERSPVIVAEILADHLTSNRHPGFRRDDGEVGARAD
jgi:aminoglycoside phosphotransferase (APT) family kinase protein